MTAATLTLTDFLLARIAEDEAVNWESHDLRCSSVVAGFPCDCGRPQRIEAECKAKRKIVRWWADEVRHGWLNDDARFVLLHLATVYADHPDYRDEWRP